MALIIESGLHLQSGSFSSDFPDYTYPIQQEMPPLNVMRKISATEVEFVAADMTRKSLTLSA